MVDNVVNIRPRANQILFQNLLEKYSNEPLTSLHKILPTYLWRRKHMLFWSVISNYRTDVNSMELLVREAPWFVDYVIHTLLLIQADAYVNGYKQRV